MPHAPSVVPLPFRTTYRVVALRGGRRTADHLLAQRRKDDHVELLLLYGDDEDAGEIPPAPMYAKQGARGAWMPFEGGRAFRLLLAPDLDRFYLYGQAVDLAAFGEIPADIAIREYGAAAYQGETFSFMRITADAPRERMRTPAFRLRSVTNEPRPATLVHGTDRTLDAFVWSTDQMPQYFIESRN
ncbi:hypothetical protein [Leucobacter sp.]